MLAGLFPVHRELASLQEQGAEEALAARERFPPILHKDSFCLFPICKSDIVLNELFKVTPHSSISRVLRRSRLCVVLIFITSKEN